MFGSNNTVIYIDRKMIRVGRVSGNQVKNEQIFAENWEADKLVSIFEEIKEAYGSSAHVILGDDLSYVLYEKIVLKEKESFEDALTQIVAERVPEEASKLHWHHRVLEKNDQEITVQIVAFVTDVYEQIDAAFKEARIKIISIEPLSLALATLIKKNAEPMLLVYKGYRKLALIVHQSAVIGSESLNTQDPKKEIKELMIFVKEKYGLILKDVKQRDLHPMVGVLRIQEKSTPVEKKAVSEKDESEPEVKKKNKKNLFKVALIPILLLILTSLLSFRGWLPEKFNVLQPKPDLIEQAITEEEVDEVVLEEIVASPSPDLIDLSQYSIQILNGSGVSGVASEVEEILLAEGFVDFETDNADNYDYIKTVVQVKSSLSEQVFSNINLALNSDYDVELSEKILSDDTAHDVIVTIGTKK